MSRSRAALIAVLLASCNPASGETTTNVDLTPEQQECVDIYECEAEWSPKIQAIGQDCGTACTWEQADEACAAAL